MPIMCTNEGCEANGVVIDNPTGLPLEDAHCGQCGAPLVDTDAVIEPEAEPPADE